MTNQTEVQEVNGQDDNRIFCISEGMVQHYAESNFNKRLNTEEMESVVDSLLDDDEARDHITDAILAAIESALEDVQEIKN